MRILAALLFAGLCACSTVPKSRAKLAALSKNRVQLWVVVHVREQKALKPDGQVDEEELLRRALADTSAAVNGGADMAVLINARCEMARYERILKAVREAQPHFPLGISALSYGPENLTEGFRLAKKFNAQMVWTEVVPGEAFEYEDDDGRYKPAETTTKALAEKTQAEVKPEAFHASGVHMKYTRPLDGKTFEEAMRAALGSVDGINITGPKTAQLADLERIRTAREIAGKHPLGLASGVTWENVAGVLPYVDYLIVGTSLKDPNDPTRIDETRVRALRERINQLGYGT